MNNALARIPGKAAAVATLVAFGIGTAVAQDDWYPSKWGADDTIGSANYLTPELVMKAANLIRTGKVYALGMRVDSETKGTAWRRLDISVSMPYQYAGATFGDNKLTGLDDQINGWMGLGTQIDGLAHMGIDGVFYNGNKVMDFAAPNGLTKLGVDGIPPMVTRGVLLDVAGHRGVDMMEAGDEIDAQELRDVAAAQDIEITEGDVVIVHTGWLSIATSDPDRFAAGEPGLSRDAAQYLVSRNVVAVGADNWGIDVLPFKSGVQWSAHEVLLARSGTYILENIVTSGLVADGVDEFMFVLGQPRFGGAVQSIINPVAIR